MPPRLPRTDQEATALTRVGPKSLVPPAAPIINTGGALDPSQVVALLLADKRSAATRKAYEADLRHFFEGEPTPGVVQEFLSLPASGVAQRLAIYKARMLTDGLAEATVNRRLSAVRSLLKFAYRLGFAQTSGAKLVDNEKTRTYRDTRGISIDLVRQLLKLPGTKTLLGLRDTAILRLLFENALRRGEVGRDGDRAGLRVKDLVIREKRLWIRGKGRGTQRQAITLSAKCVGAISAYLAAAGHGEDLEGPLFRSLCHRPGDQGREISADAIHHIVKSYGAKIDVPTLAPHKLRHSSITAYLDQTDGDVRGAQKLSRHANLNTLMHYDDDRSDKQGAATDVLSKLI